MTNNDDVVLENAVTVDGKKRLSCAQAFNVSREYNIPLKEICEICNRLEIKIHSCQLGCFK